MTISKSEERQWILRGYLRLLIRLLLIALAIWILFSQVFLITSASGNDMFPAVKDGDLVFGFRIGKNFTKNDVVVYVTDGETHIGRVAAAEGDNVMLDESGTLSVNGTEQSGEILYPTYAKEGIEYPYKVPDGCVFILGDYRTQTQDSRDFGAIELKNVKCRVITILLRRGI